LPCWISTKPTTPRATSRCTTTTTVSSILNSCGATDRTKFIRIQRGPTNEPPIDIRHTEQLGSIGSLDTAAIQNSYPVRHFGISCRQLRTNSRMHFLGLLRRRGQPGTYGPDRLIRHHGPSKGLHPQHLDHGAQLGGNHLESPARLTLLKRLADTEQRHQAAGLSRSELSADPLVTL